MPAIAWINWEGSRKPSSWGAVEYFPNIKSGARPGDQNEQVRKIQSDSTQ